MMCGYVLTNNERNNISTACKAESLIHNFKQKYNVNFLKGICIL